MVIETGHYHILELAKAGKSETLFRWRPTLFFTDRSSMAIPVYRPEKTEVIA